MKKYLIIMTALLLVGCNNEAERAADFQFYCDGNVVAIVEIGTWGNKITYVCNDYLKDAI